MWVDKLDISCHELILLNSPDLSLKGHNTVSTLQNQLIKYILYNCFPLFFLTKFSLIFIQLIVI